MNTLQQLEEKFGFRYPALYHQLYADGMLNWGILGPEWMSQQYPALRENPPLLLFANEFEPMDLPDIASQLEEFADPAYWMNIQPGLRFIPFGQNGAGDFYCFHPAGQQDEHIPVVLLWHDADRATYKARNLGDFIFRAMIESVADIEAAEFSLLPTEDFKTNLRNTLHSHGRYLSTSHLKVVTALYETSRSSNPLISDKQLQELLEREAGWELLDQTFAYRNR